MKLATSTTTIHAAGVLEQSQAKIQMNATAFRILSSGLYSDKIEAVLREIGCNAADAHIMAGKADVPFVVKLPTVLDPEFAITDFGPGLSHEDVMELYQTYFASTKATSNDVTGCFGLGSKSPYAYTDQFTVQSVQSGVQRTYFCGKDEAGTPTTMLVDTRQAPDNWHSGLRVSMPVPPQDHSAFRDKAARVYRWFATPPHIAGLTLKLPKVKQRFGNFVQYEDEVTAVIIMGNVAYPLDFGPVYHRALDDQAVADAVSHWYRHNLALIVPIGTIDVTASRESVEYTDRTIENLLKLVAEQAKALVELVTEAIGANPTDFATLSAARKQIADGNITSTVAAFRNLIDRHTAATDKAIIRGLDVVLHGRIDLGSWIKDLSWVENEGTADAKSHAPWATGYYCVDLDTGAKKLRTTPFGGSLALDGSEIIILNDNPKRARDRLRNFVFENPDAEIYWVGHSSPIGIQMWKNHLDGLPIKVPYRLASTLPAPAPKPRNITGNKRLKLSPEDREIPVLDIQQLGTYVSYGSALYDPPSKVRIADIPIEERFYVRPWAKFGRRRLAFSLDGYDGRSSPYHVISAMNELKTLGLPHIPRVAVARGGEIARWKLHDLGFAPLDVWLRDVLIKHPAVIDAMAEKAKPQIENLREASYGNNSVARAIVFDLERKSYFGTELRTALAGTQFLAEVDAILADWQPAYDAWRTRSSDNNEDPLRQPLRNLDQRVPYGYQYAGVDTQWSTRLAALDAKYPLFSTLRLRDGKLGWSMTVEAQRFARVVQMIINQQENETT